MVCLTRSALEYKTELYEKLSSGTLPEEDRNNTKHFLVRFDKKNKSRVSDLPPSDSEDENKYPESDNDYYNSDDDINIKDPGEKFVEYVDCFGRTRKCLQKDLEYLKSKDNEMRKVVEEKKNAEQSVPENVQIPECDDRSSIENEEKTTETATEESELLSSDMRRGLLREKWEAEEEELRNKSNIHYQDILFGEARTHGVGYYGFSKDEEERFKQQEALKKLREETEQKQRKAQELKLSREKLLAARIKAAKNRKRARMGLPPEEDEPETVPEPEISEEERKKRDEIELKKQMEEQLLEEARQKHLRPWDIGKEGVKEHYIMTQEEWVNKKRDERIVAFAPPTTNRKDFRSVNKEIIVQDTDMSLKFSTKKEKKKGRVKLAGLNPYKQSLDDISQKKPSEDDEEIKDRIFRKRSSQTASNYEEIEQNAPIEPAPILDLTNSQDMEFDDRLLGDYTKIMGNIIHEVPEDSERGIGVEIAPPPTFDYYGPGQNKKPKVTPEINMFEDSIEAGLKFLRNQVEEKEKSSKHPREMFLL
ncbi:hypothetical protein JTB14_033936 [Gonioctena quinquepunctata]|nr:hypothetical protein JTB14_033936 [Gonioctena quinquepunctata]